MAFMRTVVTLLIICSVPSAKATHLIGGSLGYVWMGETNPGSGNFRYTVKLNLYMNCGADSNWPSVTTLIETGGGSLPVGVYVDDPDGPQAPKILVTTVPMQLSTLSIISPETQEGCDLGSGQCVELSLLEWEVTLPGNESGYYLYFEAFARNLGIDNVFDPGNTGIGLLAHIPSATIPNSSPYMIGTVVPFACATDTTVLPFAMEDADGDSLVFSFQPPYASQTDMGGIAPPANTLNWPLVPVTYNPGFSASEPFGAGGLAALDALSGNATVSAGAIGRWVVAVECKEYRNGQLIGLTRTDLQVLSTACTTNMPPAPSGGPFTTAYTVNAGDTLCFPLSFADTEGDSLTLAVAGAIFNDTLHYPPAVITGAASADSSITNTFCWPTACAQGRAEPYYFSVLVYDNACPPRLFNAAIAVYVVPASQQMPISGPAFVCGLSALATYCVPEATSYNWSVTGGAAVLPNNEQCVTIEWYETGAGVISAGGELGSCIYLVSSEVIVDTVVTAEVGILNEELSPWSTSLNCLNGDATWRWLDCNESYTPIPGATFQAYTPSANGVYAVEVTRGSCVDTSACYAITGVGWAEQDGQLDLHVSPTITDGTVRVAASGLRDGLARIDVLDAMGRTMLSRANTGDRTVLDVSTLPPGSYTIVVRSANGMGLARIVRR